MQSKSIEIIKNLLDAYLAACAACDEAEEIWADNPESAEAEEAFDVTYRLQHEAMQALADEVYRFTDGYLTRQDVHRIIAFKQDEFIRLVSRAA